LPWSPLARGFLAGNRARTDKESGATSRAHTDDVAQHFYYTENDFAVLDALTAVARDKGVSNAQVAYAWLLGRPGVTAPIVGASKVWQLEDAVKAIDLLLTDEERARLEAPYRPRAVVGHQ
jgi:1-deoxyxylulose-5-phosphate synthase